jgi:hypothetical protein
MLAVETLWQMDDAAATQQCDPLALIANGLNQQRKVQAVVKKDTLPYSGPRMDRDIARAESVDSRLLGFGQINLGVLPRQRSFVSVGEAATREAFRAYKRAARGVPLRPSYVRFGRSRYAVDIQIADENLVYVRAVRMQTQVSCVAPGLERLEVTKLRLWCEAPDQGVTHAPAIVRVE